MSDRSASNGHDGTMTSLRGKLLVATSVIEDEPFFRSVIYLLDSDENGALGIMLNCPLASDVYVVFPEWGNSVDEPGQLFLGGPVESDSAIAIGVVHEGTRPACWQPANGRVGIVDLDGPAPASGEFDGLRLYAGYAGWSPGQLETEIAEGAWLVVDARESDLMHPNPESLWREVLSRQPDDTRFWATLPEQPGAN